MSKKIKEEKTKTSEKIQKENWNKYKKVSNRHVLVLETDLTCDKILIKLIKKSVGLTHN